MKKAFPDGHFYSPTIDTIEIKTNESLIWPDDPVILGIDFNEKSHTKYLTDFFPQFLPLYHYPDNENEISKEYDFYTNNSQFSWLDSRAFFVMLHVVKPLNIIEVGSGFSSLLAADVNRKRFGQNINITCIEPYPRPFLLKKIPGINQLIQKKVQDTPLSIFESLNEGDILFIDSSHVSKTGSDVNHIVFEIFPRIKPGVIIHIHDICLPFDYKKEWVLEEGRSWNEQYIVRAFLMENPKFEIIFSCMYAFYKFPSILKQNLNGKLYGGTSLWIKKS